MNGYFTINMGEDCPFTRKRLIKGDIEDGAVTQAEPTIRWLMGHPIKDLEEYCRSREWKLEVHLTSPF